jgi:hypothetical protein
MINISSAMGGQFAWSAAELTEEIRRIGPSALRNIDGKSQAKEPSTNPTPEIEGDLRG